ncbi:hypothetical protein PybrP1_006990 [[Pythium] brassicae (nom. inval.)]|nr:hypothetical protein PybrP1_006990 [[Pythium] brassicae (nom. inval.)]
MSSSSSGSDTGSSSLLLSQCLTSIVANDLDYALCLMNSGMFEVERRALAASDSTAASAIVGQLVRAGNITSAANAGTCNLMCTAARMSASASCCAAASRVSACDTRVASLSYCKSVIEQGFALDKQCGVSAENVGLIVACVLVALVLVVLTVLSRVFARKHLGATSASGALESRFAVATLSRGKAAIAAWRQVTNLVWKNLVIRRRRPVAFVIEQFLPVLLVTGLVFIANLDAIFGDGISGNSSSSRSNGDDDAAANAEAASLAGGRIFCTGLAALDESEIGAPTETMATFYSTGQTVIGMFLLISYVKFVSTTTTTMVIEKETRVREVMKIMGLSDATLLCSWLVTSAVLATPLAFAVAAELKFGRVFPTAEFATLVFLFWALSLAIAAFSYFVAPFFNKSRTASVASVLLWLVLFFPFFEVQSKANATKYAAALSPPTAFALAVDDLLRRAQLGSGLAYSIATVQRPITVPTAAAMSWFLVLDACVLFALGWYLEQVLPQQYGVRKPWHFLFSRAHWTSPQGSRRRTASDSFLVLSPRSDAQSPRTNSPYASAPDAFGLQLQHQVSSDGSMVLLKEPRDKNSVEPVSQALALQEKKGTCLQIRGLRKVFPGDDGDADKVAVNSLDLTLYSGHITALLGHNGAGKTTTISMLTGLIPPTAGDATLFGRSLQHEFHELRQVMGICPQHDVLLNELTVVEHLRLFGTMKHVSPFKLEEEIEAMIRDRKREDRVIVLTTHFMDEADILGDRIAIMADGELCCAGTSLFLKTRYGAGYNLTLIKAPLCDVDAVCAFLRRFVPDARCLSNFGSEAVLQLPAASSGAFPGMLQALDEQLRPLGVVQYGISVTTLEEVFLRIARDREDGAVADVDSVGQRRQTSATTSGHSRPTTDAITSTATYSPGFWTQYAALLLKRLRITKRDRKSLTNAVAIPLLFLVILVLLPEIDVANFLPNDYTSTLATVAEQANCTAANFTMVAFEAPAQQRCLTRSFDYCALGVIDCDATACCNKRDPVSPYYACNTCDRRVTNPLRPVTPCYNSQCLESDGAKLQVTLNGFLVAVVAMLAFAFVPAAIVAFIVREKSPLQNAKALQLICGADVSAYWLANWTHDLALTLVPVAAAIALVPLSNRALAGGTEVLGVAALVGSHALAVVPLAYLFSFRFEKHAVAQTSLLVFALATGGLLSILSFLCRLIDFELAAGGLTLAALDRNYLRWLFLLFPGYGLTNGLYEIASRKLSRDALFGSTSGTAGDALPPSFFGLFEGLGQDASCVSCWDRNVAGCCSRGVFDLDVAGAPVLYCVVEALLFTLLVFVLENRDIVWRGGATATTRTSASRGEDDDVQRERQKVERTGPTTADNIVIRNLRQQYGNKGGKVALDDLCLAIPKGECFGYLGINGAGKSTTMKVLTGQLGPSSGFVSLGGFDLARHRDKARTVLGYCPQFDALHDLLTVREQLELYARLKGVPAALVPLAVAEKMSEVGLGEYRDKLTRGLSGGNKRKVSTAIALMGAPRIVLLDEPSTGVDPSARRKMWDVIAGVCARAEASVVLTTHSMEECEALCTRVGILVSGRLQCLGSVAHLKHKFGRGYTVEVTVREPEPRAVAQLCGDIERFLTAAASSAAGAGRQHATTPTTPTTPSIPRDSLMGVCATLGAATRGQRILNGDGDGWVLGGFLEAAGAVPTDVFASWWLTADRSDALEAFFRAEFPGSALVEHQGEHLRFQVPKHAALRPHAVFGRLEANRARLHVNEYGVSETSLEHIFNNMAAQQDEERLEAHGIGDRDRALRPSSVQSVRSYHRSNSLRNSASGVV